MKPFSFTEKDKYRQSSAPVCSKLRENDDECLFKEHYQFRAKPCPQKIFSNYFYDKMWEDEYFRGVNRKLRAEQLLKISTLPPSMRKREKEIVNKDVQCGISAIVSQHQQLVKHPKRRKRIRRKSDYCHLTQNKKTEKQSDFITTSPSPFDFETEKRSKTRKNRKVIL